jgi:ElaB/YqjD/DUF883 family membrane-anchored ribosome-binding protein
MADQPEVILKQMEETRASLTEKLEALESQVTGTVQATTEAVTETVEAVKGTVENVTEAVKETAHSVAETFNVKIQFQRHPWGMFGGSVAVGALAGYLLSGKRQRAERNGSCEEEPAWTAGPYASAPSEPAFRQESQPSWAPPQPSTPARQEPEKPAQTGWIWDTLGHLKGLAVGSLMGVVRDLTERALPESLRDRVTKEIDNLTTHLGGEPIHGHLLSQDK